MKIVYIFLLLFVGSVSSKLFGNAFKTALFTDSAVSLGGTLKQGLDKISTYITGKRFPIYCNVCNTTIVILEHQWDRVNLLNQIHSVCKMRDRQFIMWMAIKTRKHPALKRIRNNDEDFAKLLKLAVKSDKRFTIVMPNLLDRYGSDSYFENEEDRYY